MKRHDDHETKACILETVNKAIADEGCGNASIAAHLAVTESYVSAVRKGDCPVGVRFVMGMPKPIKRRIAEAWVRFLGGVVIWPVADRESALKSVLSGILSMVDFRMLKSGLPDTEDERKVG